MKPRHMKTAVVIAAAVALAPGAPTGAADQPGLASSSAENAVYSYGAKTGEQLAKIEVGDTPKGIKFDREGRYAFAVNEGAGTISVIDPEKMEVIKTIDVGPTPHSAVASPDNKTLYVAIQGGSVVAEID